ncbi:MAG: four helix bundle protein [Phycisphaerae bacterium]|nr:four helix bundle protein [Phycisphaerae bacterium]
MNEQPAKTFTDLLLWQKSHNFVISIYRLCEKFPKDETYGLVSQMRRAAVSVPANIAEGFGKSSIKDKMRFLEISKGSLEECRYYLILAGELGYCDSSLMPILEEVSKLLNASQKSLRRKLSATG